MSYSVDEIKFHIFLVGFIIIRGKMAPTLYSCELSPPARSVLLAAKAIGLELNVVEVDLGKREQMTPEFLKMNPQHTVPTLVDDNGFVLWDHHAILFYVMKKYAKDDKYYPKDVEVQATIHQRLHFDTWSAVARSEGINPLFHKGATSIPERIVEAINLHYNYLEKFLERSDWIATNSVTIADFSLIPSIKTADIVVPVDENSHPKLWSWLKKAEEWEFYDESKRGHEKLKDMILEILKN